MWGREHGYAGIRGIADYQRRVPITTYLDVRPLVERAIRGEPDVLCGSFLTDADGTADVPMNAPWRLDQFDGWVVVEEGSEEPVLST